MGAMPIHIYDKHSPPFRPTTHDTATHATRQWPLHPDGLMARPPLAHTYQRQPARYHSPGDGHVQAHSVFGPELGKGQQQLNSSTNIFRKRTCTTFPWPGHTLHHTSPLGKDTCRPAGPLYRNKARGNNNSSEQLPTRCCNTQLAGRKNLSYPHNNTHDTNLSVWETGRPARPLDRGRRQRDKDQTGTGPWNCSSTETTERNHKHRPSPAPGSTDKARQIPSHTSCTALLPWTLSETDCIPARSN